MTASSWQRRHPYAVIPSVSDDRSAASYGSRRRTTASARARPRTASSSARFDA